MGDAADAGADAAEALDGLRAWLAQLEQTVAAVDDPGDPRRELDPDERAVVSLADDLDEPARRAELLAALDDVAELVAGLPELTARVAALQAGPERAWRLLAVALLADHLDDD